MEGGEKREQVISESGGAEDSNITGGSIMQKRKSVKKKIPGGRGFRACSYELSQSLVLPSSLQTCSKAVIHTTALLVVVLISLLSMHGTEK